MQVFVLPFSFLNTNFQQQCNELNKIITQVNKSQNFPSSSFSD